MEKQENIDKRLILLIKLAFESLDKLYSKELRLFTHYIRQGQLTAMPLPWSITYTAITLLSLIKARQFGWPEHFGNETLILLALVQYINHGMRFGDLGLILWANAECDGRYEKVLLNGIVASSQNENVSQTPTSELAWLLTGICCTYQNLNHNESIHKLAVEYYQAITNNFNAETGLFCHTFNKVSMTDLRPQIGNFADQIYSIYALSRYYEVFKQPDALQIALLCANRICELQGKQGQWWWHYHSHRNVVVSGYPVFAVHQDGMAPMALRKLSLVSGRDFNASIQLGLNWLFGGNELSMELVDWNKKVIWRDIEPKKPVVYGRYLSMALAEIGILFPQYPINTPSLLKINREMRPYELGWLIFSFADLDLSSHDTE